MKKTEGNQPRLLSIRAAAEYTGLHVWFLRKLVWESKIAHVRVTAKIYFDRKDLDSFVDSNKVAARA